MNTSPSSRFSLSFTDLSFLGNHNSTSKFAEHGGNHDDDLSVGLILHNPAISKQVINDQLYSQAVAPTVLKWLGLDQSQLTGAVKEGITYLPGTY